MTNKRFTTTRLKTYIAKLDKADYEASLQWYYEAHKFANDIMLKTGLSFPTVCKVIAVLSPSVSWEVNKKDAENLCKAYVKGKSFESVTVATYGNNKKIAWEILQGKTDLVQKPTNPKTYSFYKNILNPWCKEHVTIDRHAIRAITPCKKTQDAPIRGKRYKDAVNAYKRLAEDMRLIPCEVQALAWVASRGKVN